jgi:hypothetical protein
MQIATHLRLPAYFLLKGQYELKNTLLFVV